MVCRLNQEKINQMESIKTTSWENFLEKKDEILSEYKTHTIGYKKISIPILFRGQANSAWKLNTTLERQSDVEWHFKEYILLARYCAVQVESFEKTDLTLPSYDELNSQLQKGFGKGFINNVPFVEWLIFLRHHGLPSPLLDWTKSEYLASYFSFREKTNSEFVAVYAYVETPTSIKIGDEYGNNINNLGPSLKTHKRHFLQKATYTIAAIYDEKKRDHVFVNHEDIFNKSESDQDILIKFLIPATERLKVLDQLNSAYNINSFSLFQTMDSLVETIGMEKITFK